MSFQITIFLQDPDTRSGLSTWSRTLRVSGSPSPLVSKSPSLRVSESPSLWVSESPSLRVSESPNLRAWILSPSPDGRSREFIDLEMHFRPNKSPIKSPSPPKNVAPKELCPPTVPPHSGGKAPYHISVLQAVAVKRIHLFFLFLFVVTKPEKLYSVSCGGRELVTVKESGEGYLTGIWNSGLYHESWDTPQKSWVSNCLQTQDYRSLSGGKNIYWNTSCQSLNIP